MGVTGGLIGLAAALLVATVLGVTLVRERRVTAGLSPNTIGFVMSWTAQMLTKRRAVDFCHVATAICPRLAA